jgi:sugar lactone lactonase YvrE
MGKGVRLNRYEVIAHPHDPACRDQLGEGPFWSRDQGALYWVDIPRRRAFRLDPSSGEGASWRFDAICSAIFPTAGGGLMVALKDGLYRFDPATGATTTFARPDPDPGNRSNETRCDPQGRIWLGTMHDNIGPDGEPLPVSRSSGGYWCVGPGGLTTKIMGGVGITNTLCWSPDGARLYCADTLKRVIWSFAYAPEGPVLSDQQVFVEGGEGGPDGSAMDEEGCLWTARWGAGKVVRYRPDGRIDREIVLPVAQPSSCAFGGGDLKTLYITSARWELEAPGALDGALFAVNLDVAGLPMTPFSG